MSYIIYDGVDSRDYGVAVYFEEIDTIPERDIDEYSVPGRNGALTIDKGSFKNVDHAYQVIGFGENYRLFRAFLNEISKHAGYLRLEDSFNPDEFYSARRDGNLELGVWRDRDTVKCELRFSRDPRRFLVSGEAPVTLDDDGTVLNPTLYAANPVIKVTGSGTLTINTQTVVISDAFSETIIDSERQDCYSGENNANSAVAFGNGKFPVLQPGNNEISWTGDIEEVEITPRFWRL